MARSQTSVGAASPDFSEVFAAFSSALTLDLIPASTLEAACVNVYGTLACATAATAQMLASQGFRP